MQDYKQQKPINAESQKDEKIISFSLILLFLLVITTGIISFLLLNRSLQTISSNLQPDTRLILTKTIDNELKEAENNVKSFSLTQSDTYLKGFYKAVENTERNLYFLDKRIHEQDSLKNYVDSLSAMIEKKYLILDSLLEIQDEYRVQQALDNVIGTIQEDSLQDWEAENGGFFRRLFTGRKERMENLENRRTERENLNREIEEVRQQEIERERRIRETELQLINRDGVLTESIASLLSKFDRATLAGMKQKTEMAQEKSRQMSWVIGAFVVLASLLLAFALYTIFRFVKRNNQYKVALKKANEEALNLAKTRESFLASMSHEIRTPMNVISGFTSQLLKTKLNDEQKKQLQMMQHASEHLLLILNDILDFSRLEAGKLPLVKQSFYLKDLLEKVVGLFRQTADQKKIDLLLSTSDNLPLIIKSDPVRLRQILINLLGNAVKFTSQGKVELNVSTIQKSKKDYDLTLMVSDTGSGIAKEDLKKIFDAFEQSQSNSKESSHGTGLGLAITKKLTELFKAKIKLESEIGKGTKVKIVIPVKKGSEIEIAEEKRHETLPSIPAGLNILLIDDEPYNRELIKSMLKSHDVKIVEAVDAEDGLDQFLKVNFDLVLTDIHLPGMSGIELTREIRKLPDDKKSAISVIALTASVTHNDQEKYKKAGMDAFLPKPVTEKDLLQVISELCKIDNGRGYPLNNISTQEVKDETRFDLQELKRLSQEDEKFYREMVALFITTTASGLEALRLHLENNEIKQLKEQAHKIISPARHLKAVVLISHLKDIEMMEENGCTKDQLKELLEKASVEFEYIKNALNK